MAGTTITYKLKLDNKSMLSELNKLENEIKRLNDIQKRYNKNNKVASEASTKRALKIKDLKKQLGGLTKTILIEEKAQKKEIKATFTQIKADRTYFKGVEKLNKQKQKQITLNNKVAASQRKAATNTNIWSKASQSFAFKFNFLGNLMSSMAIGGVAGLIRGFKSLGDIVTGFSKSQSKLASVLLVSKDNIKGLTDEAIRLGGATIYTSKQITEMMTTFAKQGFNQKQILGLSEATSNLAMALDVELSESAQLVSTTMKAFKMDASESSHIAEVLGVSTTKTALSFEKLSNALPYVATSAKQMNFSLEETTAMLGTLVDRGLKAETAGVQLRKIFAELSKSGMSYNEAMEQLNNSSDKAKTAIDLFGIRAKDAAIILSETQTETKKLTTDLEGLNGELEQMAKIQQDNLSGDKLLLASAFERFILQLENGKGSVSGFFRGITQGITGVFNTLTQEDILDAYGINDRGAFQEFDKERLDFLTNYETMQKLLNKASVEDTKDSYRKLGVYLKAHRNKQLFETEGQTAEIRNAYVDLYNEYEKAVKKGYKNAKTTIEETNKEIITSEEEITKKQKSIKSTYWDDLLKQKLEEARLRDEENNELWAQWDEEQQIKDEQDALELQKLSDIAQQKADIEESFRQQKLREEERLQSAIDEVKKKGVDTAIQIGNLLFDNKMIGYDNDIQQLEQYKESGAITEEQYAERVTSIKRKQFEAQKKNDVANVWIDAFKGIANVWSEWSWNPVVAGILSAMPLAVGSVQSANINKQQFYGESGGMISGRSHRQGGENVNMQGGEYLMSQKAVSRYIPLITELNTSANSGKDANIIDYNKLANAMNSKKVYVVSHDITDQQGTDVKVKSRATF